MGFESTVAIFLLLRCLESIHHLLRKKMPMTEEAELQTYVVNAVGTYREKAFGASQDMRMPCF